MSQSVTLIDHGLGNLHSVEHALRHVGATVRRARDVDELGEPAAIVLPGVGSYPAGWRALVERGFVEPLRRHAAAGRALLGICLGMQLLFDEGTEFERTPGLGILPGVVERIAPSRIDPTVSTPTVAKQNGPAHGPAICNGPAPGAAIDNGPAIPLAAISTNDASDPTSAQDPTPFMPARRVPHVGWTRVWPSPPWADWSHPALAGLPPGFHAYFLHSYHARPRTAAHEIAVCTADARAPLGADSIDGSGRICAAVAAGAVLGVQFHPEKSGRHGLALLAGFLRASASCCQPEERDHAQHRVPTA